MTGTEFGSIEREIYVDAAPEVVFEVVSKPEHISEWWTDDASFTVRPGATGEFVWGDRVDVVAMSVVEVDPPRRFSFRWCYAGGAVSDDDASMLVTIDLVPAGEGTTIRLVETGFREMGWEAAKLEEVYNDHVSGWDTFIPRLGDYVARLVATR
ncbi:SRPBCC domain-containing protein [Nocardia sp. 2]|uniref:SRPBCC domain-containing protein n=1 Tax=Nocardia acididurans TaxID=2802282 RepID=A0ABS1MHL8_9NOCA|nr:SRPBCC domain-containing protein [Nocardia acididurans]MBL1080157.1 SRPBCC domain-containing protein [Nocardia acididurans]